LKTSRARSSELWKPTDRNNHPADSASSVLPSAIATEVAAGTGVSKFANNAPSRIPGQARKPSNNTAAIAIPVGGQTGETFV